MKTLRNGLEIFLSFLRCMDADIIKNNNYIYILGVIQIDMLQKFNEFFASMPIEYLIMNVPVKRSIPARREIVPCLIYSWSRESVAYLPDQLLGYLAFHRMK
jgi:hypothetical protein